MSSICRALTVLLFLVLTSRITADEVHARYFDQLRQRGLFSLAESEAITRLSAPNISLTEKCDYSIELSRTLTEHAGFVSDEQRNELWQRAKSTIQELLDQDRANPRAVLLKGQLAAVLVAEGDWLRAEREIRPFDEPLLKQAQSACTKAIEQLKSIESTLVDPPKDSNSKKSPGTPAGYELRTLLHQVRLQLGQSYRNRAELSPAVSAERTRDLTDAEQSLRRLLNAADEPIQARAKLQLAACLRLRNELDRASENLASLETAEAKSSQSIQDEIIAEQARLLLDRKLPTEAAQLLLKTRGKRQRLTGELWLLQVRSLISLREFSIQKHQEALADQITEQINTAVTRCEQQVGGYWSRRCRALWDNVQTAQKYGAELDSLMQQARSDFTAGRIDAALAGYASAEKTAASKKQPELAMELGFTRASILLDALRFESAAAEFLRLAADYPGQPRAAKSHLLGAYCLGRFYDEKKTQSRREAYTDALTEHLKDYSSDPTVNDARFLKAQLEEQRLQATQALPLYLQVESNHSRALEAMAGAARCYETIVRRMAERRLVTDELEREASGRLSAYLSVAGDAGSKWTAAHADIALRLAAILLMGSVEPTNPANGRIGKVANTFAGGYPARCEQAADWLRRVTAYIQRRDDDAPSAEVAERLRQRAAPLMVVALAGSGKTREAEQGLNSLSVSPSELLAVLDRLTQFAATTTADQRMRLASLQLQVTDRLSKQRDQLSPAESDTLDRCLMKSYAAAYQYKKATEIGFQIAEKSSKDVEKQREMGRLFSDLSSADAQKLAKQCWRRVESLSKAGSPEWLTARIAILDASIQLGELDEARKLMQVTKVLYPTLGGDAFKDQFDAINKELQTRSK